MIAVVFWTDPSFSELSACWVGLFLHAVYIIYDIVELEGSQQHAYIHHPCW